MNAILQMRFNIWSEVEMRLTYPDNVINYSWLIKQISDGVEKFELQEIAFDLWVAIQVI